MMIHHLQSSKSLKMKTCVMTCHTLHWITKTESSLFKYIQKHQLGFKAKGLFNSSLGLLFLQIGYSGCSCNSPSNRVPSRRLWTTHKDNSKGQIYFRWISKLFKSADFKPLQIRSYNFIKEDHSFIVR